MTEETNIPEEAEANIEAAAVPDNSEAPILEPVYHEYEIHDFNPKTDWATVYFPEANTTITVQVPRLPNGELLDGEPLDYFISSLIPLRLDTVKKGEPAPNSESILKRVKSVNLPDFSTPEVDRMKRFREQRQMLLGQSDWTQLPDNALSKEKREEWKKYRQALRDIPQRYASADLNKVKIEFPTPPEE
jgi:hypothetical protein